MKVLADNSELIYLFGFARSEILSSIGQIGKEAENTLLCETFGEVSAVFSRVPQGEFCGPDVELQMQDLEWIGPRVCRHERVVEGMMHYSPVLPARFGTLFSSPEGVTRLIEKNYNAVLDFLEWTSEREEWAVKVFLDRSGAKEALFSKALEDCKDSFSSSPGMRYFQEQRLRSRVEKELNERVREICTTAAEHLTVYSSDFRERRILSQSVTGSPAQMVCNWAFLVPRDYLPGFCARIDLIDGGGKDMGLHFERSGPWPPYSFCPLLGVEAAR